MTSYLLAGPATEPVTLADARAFLRLDDTNEDAFVTTLLTAARLHLEGVTGRALIAQSWRVVLDCWPADRIVVLVRGPVLSITEITAYDADGTPHALVAGEFLPEHGATPARLFVPANITGMPVLRDHLGLEVDYVAGYGLDPEDVPQDLKQAILTLVGYWFEHRDAVVVAGAGAIVPAGFDRLIAPYKRVQL